MCRWPTSISEKLELSFFLRNLTLDFFQICLDHLPRTPAHVIRLLRSDPRSFSSHALNRGARRGCMAKAHRLHAASNTFGKSEVQYFSRKTELQFFNIRFSHLRENPAHVTRLLRADCALSAPMHSNTVHAVSGSKRRGVCRWPSSILKKLKFNVS